MEIPNWGREVIQTQHEHSATLEQLTTTQHEHSATLEQLTTTQHEHSAILEQLTTTQHEHSAILEQHSRRFDDIDRRFDGIDRRLDKNDAVLGDMMTFLIEQANKTDQRFEAFERRIDAKFEAIHSDFQAFNEIQKLHWQQLTNHDQRIDVLEQSQAVVQPAVASLAKRVSALEK